MGGRAEVLTEEYPPQNGTHIHLVSGVSTEVNVSVYGMGCGWA
eukprot:COSAG02_NODE_10929_length_1830_cov_2.502600_2_plen_43_part_00